MQKILEKFWINDDKYLREIKFSCICCNIYSYIKGWKCIVHAVVDINLCLCITDFKIATLSQNISPNQIRITKCDVVYDFETVAFLGL